MKRFAYVGIAVVAILGIAITMALVSNPALADKSNDDGAALVENETVQTGDTAVPAVDLVPEDGETAVFANGSGNNSVDEDDNLSGIGTGNQYGDSSSGDSFIDEDGDGICDDCDNEPGTGVGEHNGNGNGAGDFVDGDGTAPADGTGNQYGRQSDNTGKGGANGDQNESGSNGGNQRGANGGQGNRGGQTNNTP